MTVENNPFELGLGKYCDLDQEAEFIGKESLRQIKAEGIQQKLVGVGSVHRKALPC
jgi:aminomethyltransferase